MYKILIIFSLFATSLTAQPLNLLNYNVGEGLSQSQAWCILEDRKGYLWCGTQGGGLNRFDGTRFEQFSVEEGLPSAFIYTQRKRCHWNRHIKIYSFLQ